MDPVDRLAELIARYAPGDGVHQTAISRLVLIRASQPTEPLHTLHKPALCIVAQGKKQVFVGNEMVVYDRNEYLIVAVSLPIVGQIIEAEPRQPYLCLRLDLDPAVLSDVMTDLNLDAAPDEKVGSGLMLNPTTPELLGAAVRLAELLSSPKDSDYLAPLAERELLYRLFTGDQASKMQEIARADSRLRRINRAISWLKEHYREPFRLDDLAAAAQMSPSALHQHFKAVTALSPLQYQKRLRLQEARRLMVGSASGATSAGLSVGYDSPAQFSREYRRLFGAPPRRDAARLRAQGPRLETNVP